MNKLKAIIALMVALTIGGVAVASTGVSGVLDEQVEFVTASIGDIDAGAVGSGEAVAGDVSVTLYAFDGADPDAVAVQSKHPAIVMGGRIGVDKAVGVSAGAMAWYASADINGKRVIHRGVN